MRCLHKMISVYCCLVSTCLLRAADSGALKYFRSDAGQAPDTQPLPDNLDAPNSLVWKVAMDGGHSTPVLSGDRLFLTSWRSGARELATVCLDEKDGHVLWRNPVVPEQVEQTHEIGSPATASPATDGKRVFAYFG